VRCTRPLHATQVIPVTGMVQDSDIATPAFPR
jgi:hypothetical protein